MPNQTESGQRPVETPAKTKIAIASLGDPSSRKDWSGTSRNIWDAMEKAGHAVVGINASMTSSAKKQAHFLRYQLSRLPLLRWNRSQVAHQIALLKSEVRSDYLRAAPSRLYSAERVNQQSRALGVRHILHMSTKQLPVHPVNSDVKHYLVCDSTWNATFEHTIAADRYPPKTAAEFERIEKAVFGNVTHFFPLSTFVRDNLVSHYGIPPERITVIGSGRGGIAPYYGEKDYANGYILFTAKLRFKEKGGQLLLDGFRIAQQRNPKLKLVIVGQDYYAEEFKGIPNVTALGHTSWEELQNLFNQAALFAMPALQEPYGLVYLEALVCRTPILGLDRFAFPEFAGYGKYGFVVPTPTPESIADTLLDAFSDPERLRAMGDAGQKYCMEYYSWDNAAEKISRVIERH